MTDEKKQRWNKLWRAYGQAFKTYLRAHTKGSPKGSLFALQLSSHYLFNWLAEDNS